MRIGVYVDGFNLYYGAKSQMQYGSWKWLDIRRLVTNSIREFSTWENVDIVRIVYFTSEVTSSPETLRRQQAYIEALRIYESVDYVVYGKFKVYKDQNIAAYGSYREFELVTMEENPLPGVPWLQLNNEFHVVVSHQLREEKESDVNLASHLLIDTLTGGLDAAVVVSNDSDLRFPITFLRDQIPLGLLNPQFRPIAGGMGDHRASNVEGQWNGSLRRHHFLEAQLPNEVAGVTKPDNW